MTRRAYLPGLAPVEVQRTEQLALGVTPEPDRGLSQWFTQPRTAEALIDLVGPLLTDARQREFPLRILEPSAGSGALVRILRRRCPLADIEAVELDARWGPALAEAGASRISICDYLTRPAPRHRYDLTVSNPPFTGGEEAAHVAKMLDESDRLALLFPARGLFGRDRHNAIWSRVGTEWWLRQQVNLIGRPKFSTDAGSDEYVLLDLRRTPGPCEVRWL